MKTEKKRNSNSSADQENLNPRIGSQGKNSDRAHEDSANRAFTGMDDSKHKEIPYKENQNSRRAGNSNDPVSKGPANTPKHGKKA